MNTKWKSSTLVLALALVLSTPAFAHHHPDTPAPPGGGSGTAPEVDPSLAIAGISFLGGSLVVLRSRRRK
jgi:LPXTG-motif cell wall-anchored protein